MSGKTPRDIRAALWDSGFEDDADTGGYPDADVYLAEFSYRIGHTVTRQQWIAARRESMIPSGDVLALAKSIGETSRLAIYTNNGPIVKSSLDELFPEAAAIFKEPMPGTGIPDFSRHARTIAQAGVYDFQVHHDQILVPVLLRQWNIDRLHGLKATAERARERLLAHVDRVGRVARRLVERRTPEIAT
jgi:hypothetical protein